MKGEGRTTKRFLSRQTEKGEVVGLMISVIEGSFEQSVTTVYNVILVRWLRTITLSLLVRENFLIEMTNQKSMFFGSKYVVFSTC